MNTATIHKWDETNGHGIRLRGQSLNDGIQHADALLSILPPALRAAYEAERARIEAELNAYLVQHGYGT